MSLRNLVLGFLASLLLVALVGCGDNGTGTNDNVNNSLNNNANPVCGNGQQEGTEECDGTDLGGETCTGLGYPSGTLACQENCAYDRTGCDPPLTCGDYVVDSLEQCDGSNLDGASCDSLSFDGGSLVCAANCIFDTSECFECGDGEVNPGEACDGSDFAGSDCQSVGFDGGTLVCTPSCERDTSECYRCGDGVLNGLEECDTSDFGTASCQSIAGHDEGTLSCSAACTIEALGCYSCGDATLDGPEVCDGTNVHVETCQSQTGFPDGTLGCFLDCLSFDVSDCHDCGNGTVEGPEACDTADFSSATCLSETGHTEGALACTSGCTLDTSACSTCSDGIVEGNEVCDDANVTDWDGCRDCGIAEFQVNSYTTGWQDNASVAMSPSGQFVVVWESGGQDGSGVGVYGQLYSDQGTLLGSEFQINTYVTDNQDIPDVAMAADGSFVVVWHSRHQDGEDGGVFGQRYSSTGVPIGAEFPVNTLTAGNQGNAPIAMAPSGRFVVVWTSTVSSIRNVFARTYSASGVPDGPEYQLNSLAGPTVGDVAITSDGSFIAVWHRGLGGAGDVYGRRFDSQGSALGSEFLINGNASEDQTAPRISAADDGQFVVVWVSWAGQDGDFAGVYGRRFDPNGAVLGSEFQVNNYTAGGQVYPDVSMNQDGSFIVVWESWYQDGDQMAMVARRYDSAGTPIGTEYILNLYTPDDQEEAAVASALDGRHVVVWQSWAQDGDGYGVYAQRYSSTGQAVGLTSW